MSCRKGADPDPERDTPVAAPRLIRRMRQRVHDQRRRHPAPDHDDWETLGTFVIEFQQRDSGHDDTVQRRTLAHHMESGETSEWQTLVKDALLSWILGCLFKHTDVRTDEDKPEH